VSRATPGEASVVLKTLHARSCYLLKCSHFAPRSIHTWRKCRQLHVHSGRRCRQLGQVWTLRGAKWLHFDKKQLLACNVLRMTLGSPGVAVDTSTVAFRYGCERFVHLFAPKCAVSVRVFAPKCARFVRLFALRCTLPAEVWADGRAKCRQLGAMFTVSRCRGRRLHCYNTETSTELRRGRS